MSSKEEARIFVGGLSWNTSDRELEDTFSRFGKVVDAQVNRQKNLEKLFGIMVDRDTGRPRGFGFVTFSDRRAMEDAIADMHGQELDGRNISVNKAQPKMGDDPGYGGYGGSGGGYSSDHRGSYRGSDGPPPAGRSDCFKCGRPGHWARECPSAGGGGGGGRFSSRSKVGGGGGRGDRYGDRYADDRYDGGRYGDRDRVGSRETMHDSGRRDRYGSDRGDRYPPAGGDRYYGGSDRYGGGADRYPQNGYGKERSYDRDGPKGGGGGGGGGGGSDRYGGGGPVRYESGSYRERPGPYDRPTRGGRHLSYDR